MVTRSASPADGRVTLVQLTPKGRDTIEHAAPGHVEYVRKVVIDQFDAEELQQLRALTTRIAVALATDRDAPDCVRYALGPFED